MARHAPRYGVDAEQYLDAFGLQQVGEVPYRILGLRYRHAVARHYDHSPHAIHQHGHLFRRCGLDPACVDVVAGSDGGRHSSHTGEEHVGQ